jgi:hypothetical protein
MKKIYYASLFALTLSACANAKKEEKALQKEILDIHEKVMADDEKAVLNKMKLDTLILKADSLKIDKQEAVALNTKLGYADDAMSDWMKKFDPDNSGKNHDDVMKYLKAQRAQVKQIDSLLINATTESATYLQKTTGK